MSASNTTGGTLKFNTIKPSSVKNLDKSNWVKHKYSMRLHLEYHSLWYLLEGTKQRENGLVISTDRQQQDVNELCVILLVSVMHEDNIGLFVKYTEPSEIWVELKRSHMTLSSRNKFYYLRVLINTSFNESKDIGQHPMSISKTATCLRKLCKDGMLSVDSIENAAVI